MMFSIKFTSNRKRIPFIAILICYLSSFKKRIVNTEITRHIQEIISIGVQEGKLYIFDDIKYHCLKDTKNLVLKLIFPDNKEYIIKVYAYSNSWFNEGVRLQTLIKTNKRKYFPMALEYGYFKINIPLYKNILLYNVFPFYDGNTYEDSCITEEKKIGFFKELGLYYLLMEHFLNERSIIKVINSLSHYHFGENMYNLAVVDSKKN